MLLHVAQPQIGQLVDALAVSTPALPLISCIDVGPYPGEVAAIRAELEGPLATGADAARVGLPETCAGTQLQCSRLMF